MKKTFILISIIMVMISMNFIGSKKVSANENKNTTFTVKAVHTDIQKDKKLPYYYFDGQKGKTYKIKVAIKNVSKQNIQVATKIKNGLSNPYGAMEYTSETKTKYSHFIDKKYEMKNYITGPERINLKPNEEKTVEYSVKIPSDLEVGEILGALGFMDAKDLELKKDESNKNGATLISRLEYVISVFVNLSQKTTPKIVIDKTEIDVSTKFPKLELYLQNINPMLIKDVDLAYKVYKKNDLTKPIFEGKKKIERFSPSTTMIYLIAYEGEVLEEGNYVIDVTLSSGTLTEIVEKRMEFEITKKEEKTYADKTTNVPKIPMAKSGGIMNYIWYIVGGIILFILGMIIPGWFRRRKDKKELNQKLPIKDDQTEKVELNTNEEIDNQTTEETKEENKDEPK